MEIAEISAKKNAQNCNTMNPNAPYLKATLPFVYVVVQFGFWCNLDFPLFDIHYHILA